MATILSSPTVITVRNPPAPGTSTLAMLAASMAPGTWAQLVVQNQDACLSDNGNTRSMIPYCGSMPWNPVTKQIEIMGQDHNGGGMRYVQYDEASNQFFVVSDPTIFSGGHGYDHVTVNPTTGDLYYKNYGGGAGPVIVHRKPAGSATFTQLPSGPNVGYQAVAMGACWWSGSFTGGGVQGSLMLYQPAADTSTSANGIIIAYNPLTNSWFYNQNGRSPFNGQQNYHAVMEYSVLKNVAVYGGGNTAGNRLWRMTSSGSVVELTNVPSGKTVGSSESHGKLVNEPATGNFLLLSAGQLWELNPDGAGTWTQKATPPTGVGNPNVVSQGRVIAAPIPDYGVVAFITQNGAFGGTFFLYKNA